MDKRYLNLLESKQKYDQAHMEYTSWKMVAEGNGICRSTFLYRVRQGMSYESAANSPLSNTSPKKYRKDKENENE